MGGDNTSAKAAGLPNITGNISNNSGYGLLDNRATYGYITNGAFGKIQTNKTTNYQSASTSAACNLEFDASRSNAIYGSSDTVQPPALSLIPQIKY